MKYYLSIPFYGELPNCFRDFVADLADSPNSNCLINYSGNGLRITSTDEYRFQRVYVHPAYTSLSDLLNFITKFNILSSIASVFPNGNTFQVCLSESGKTCTLFEASFETENENVIRSIENTFTCLKEV